MKIVRDSAVRQEPAQPQAVSPEENRFSIRPRQIALFFLWMLAFTLLARGTSGALLPEVQLSTPAPNTITQSLTATGTIQWAAGSLFYLPEGLLVEAVFVSEGEAVQEGDKIAALRREDVEQKLRSLQAELAQKQTEYARLTKPVAADSYTKSRKAQGGTISEITIHHCASILTIEALGALWQREGRKGSSHYGVSETNIGQYVHERDVAWTNGNWEANCRTVTIETSNSGGAPEWPVSDTTFQTLVTLVADIARRNGLGKLVKGKNLTWHSMYAATACPGPYLSGKLQELVDKANTINGF